MGCFAVVVVLFNYCSAILICRFDFLKKIQCSKTMKASVIKSNVFWLFTVRIEAIVFNQSITRISTWSSRDHNQSPPATSIFHDPFPKIVCLVNSLIIPCPPWTACQTDGTMLTKICDGRVYQTPWVPSLIHWAPELSTHLLQITYDILRLTYCIV